MAYSSDAEENFLSWMLMQGSIFALQRFGKTKANKLFRW
jgi:hypothetical protein